MLRRLGFALLLASLALLIASSALAIPVARMQLWSEPGDPIGEGRTFDVIYETDLGGDAYNVSPDPTVLQLLFRAPIGSDLGALLQLAAGPPGTPLVPGFYGDTFHNRTNGPMLILELENRTFGSHLTGEFTLFEYVRSGFPLSKMVLEFTQYANHSPAALRGRIEFDAAGLTNIPEPSAAFLMLLGLAGLSRRRQST